VGYGARRGGIWAHGSSRLEGTAARRRRARGGEETAHPPREGGEVASGAPFLSPPPSPTNSLSSGVRRREVAPCSLFERRHRRIEASLERAVVSGRESREAEEGEGRRTRHRSGSSAPAAPVPLLRIPHRRSRLAPCRQKEQRNPRARAQATPSPLRRRTENGRGRGKRERMAWVMGMEARGEVKKDKKPSVWGGGGHSYSLSARLISHQPAVLFSQNKPATSHQYFSLRTNQHQPSATSQPNRSS
jgi:hypothetical protein